MQSCQLTCFLCLCVSGLWPVYGKIKEEESLIGSIPGSESDLTVKMKAVDWGKGMKRVPHEAPLSDSDVLYVPTPSRHGAFTQDMRFSDVIRRKRTPSGFTARGFHEGAFDRDFGHFSPVKRMQKRRPEADAAGFYGDTFSNGFGEFETMKRDEPYMNDDEIRQFLKRTEMGANGFHGDTFTQGFGNFDTMKKRMDNWMETGVVKRRPEMTKSGFHGDVFNSGFGEFHPMRK